MALLDFGLFNLSLSTSFIHFGPHPSLGHSQEAAIVTTTSLKMLYALFEITCIISFLTVESAFLSLNTFCPVRTQRNLSARCDARKRSTQIRTQLFGWFDSFPPKVASNSSQRNDAAPDSGRRQEFPEQYPATYELLTRKFPGDSRDAAMVRPLLKQTQLESRALQVVYDAVKQGWNTKSFHSAVDGKGAAVILATTSDNRVIGGYNPKGWASLGGARPSVAAFLFYSKGFGTFQKLRKVGGGGLACSRDDPSFGISFGPDALIIGLQPGKERYATSKLGPYFERGPEDLPSLCKQGGVQLKSLKVLVGKYASGETIPYSGGVLDMTSG